MLPFLKPKKIATTIIANYNKDKLEDRRSADEAQPAMMSAAESIISAVHAKDATKLAEVLESIMNKEETNE